jgi:hypothetical protein
MPLAFQIVGTAQVRALGIAYCLLLLLGVVFSLLSSSQSRARSDAPPAKLPHGLSKPMLALELARTVDDVEQIVGDQGDPRRAKMLALLRTDTFGFIPTYWLYFLSLSWLLAHRSIPYSFWFGVAVAVCATAAALFDLAENHYIRVTLETPLSQTAADTVRGIYRSSLIKWLLIFVALALLSRLFLERGDLLVIIGILFLITSVLGFVGLRHNPAIEWSYVPLLVTLVSVAATFAFFPARFLRYF